MSTSPPTTAQLLEHRHFVAALARRLTSDEDAARELAQDVWVETLQSPPRHGENLRGWFRTLARRAAIRRWRRTELRRDAERFVQAEAEEGEGKSLEHQELELRAFPDVAEEILRLDEPYRAVVLMRFYDGLTPTEIARRLERSLNTVKSQLRRAMERLRERLDGRYGDRATWSVLLLAEAARMGVPVGGAPAAPLASAGRVAPRSFAGWLPVAASIALLGTLLVAGLRVLGPAAEGEDVAARSVDAPADGERGLDAISVAGPAAAAERAPAVQAPTETVASPSATGDASRLPRLVVDVVDEAGEPVEGAGVFVLRAPLPASAGGGTEARLDRRGQTDAGGRAVFPIAASDRLDVPDKADLDGRVELVVRAPGRATTPCHYVAVPPEGAAVTVTLAAHGFTFAGRVVGPGGEAVAGASVTVQPRSRRREEQPDGTIVADLRQRAVSDADGRFELAGVELGVQRAFVAADGFITQRVELGDDLALDPETGRHERVVGLVHGGVVSGQVRDGGEPVAGAGVWMETAQLARRRVVTADAEGVFVLEGLPPGTCLLQAVHPDEPSRRASTRVVVESGDEQRWQAELRERTGLHVEVVDDGGRPVQAAVLQVVDELEAPDGSRVRRRVRELVTDAEGRARTFDLVDDSFDVKVYESRWSVDEAGYPLTTVEDVHPSARPQRIVVHGIDAQRARLTGRVADAAGEPVVEGRLRVHALVTDHERRVDLASTEGTFDLDRLPRGTYRCTLERAGRTDVVLGEYALGPGRTYELGTLWAPQDP